MKALDSMWEIQIIVPVHPKLHWRTGMNSGQGMWLTRPSLIRGFDIHGDYVAARELPLAVTPDERRAVFVFSNNEGSKASLEVWDLVHEAIQWTLRSEGGVVAVAIAADGHRAISASGESGIVRIWNLDDGNELWPPLRHEGGAFRVAITPNGRWAVSANGRWAVSSFQTFKIWDTVSGKELRTLTGQGDGTRVLAIAPDASRVFSASWGIPGWRSVEATDADGTLRIDDLTTGDICTFPYDHRFNLDVDTQTAVIAAKGRRALFASKDYRHIWSLGVFDLEGKLPSRRLLHGQGGRNIALAVTDDGHRIISGSVGTFKIWDLDTKADPQTFTQDNGRHGVALTSKGRQAVTVTSDGTAFLQVRVWNLGR